MGIKLIEELADFEKVYTHSQYCIFSSDANSYVPSIDMPSIALLSEINNLNSRWAGWLSRAKLAESKQDRIDACFVVKNNQHVCSKGVFGCGVHHNQPTQDRVDAEIWRWIKPKYAMVNFDIYEADTKHERITGIIFEMPNGLEYSADIEATIMKAIDADISKDK